jgi:hypothetical protein
VSGFFLHQRLSDNEPDDPGTWRIRYHLHFVILRPAGSPTCSGLDDDDPCRVRFWAVWVIKWSADVVGRDELLLGGKIDMPLGLLWSLAVEEHRYLVFPVIFLGLRKCKERFVIGLMAAVVAVWLWRTALVLTWHVGQNVPISAPTLE